MPATAGSGTLAADCRDTKGRIALPIRAVSRSDCFDDVGDDSRDVVVEAVLSRE